MPVNLLVRCKLQRNGDRPWRCCVSLSCQSRDEVKDALRKQLAETYDGALRCPGWHRYKVVKLFSTSSSSRMQEYSQPGAVWPNTLKKLVLRAVIQVKSRQPPKELRVHVMAHGDWPKSYFLTDSHRVRCGCESCKKLQDGGETDSSDDDVGGYSKRAAPRQYRGFWKPANFVQHVLGVKIGGGRQPEDVPQLRSKYWLRLSCKGSRTDGRTVKLTIPSFAREFSYRWGYQKGYPDPVPEDQE